MSNLQIETVSDAIQKLEKARRNVLSVLREQGRYGWEKWLQVELAFRLTSFGSPTFEVMYNYNNLYKKPKSKAKFANPFIDLQFRADKSLKNRFTAIEIKVNETERGLGPLLSDFIKIRAIGPSQWAFRSVIGILAYGADDARKDTNYRRLMSALPGKLIVCPNYNFFIIGWATSLTKNMTHEAYCRWLAQLEEIYEYEGVIRKTARGRD